MTANDADRVRILEGKVRDLEAKVAELEGVVDRLLAYMREKPRQTPMIQNGNGRDHHE